MKRTLVGLVTALALAHGAVAPGTKQWKAAEFVSMAKTAKIDESGSGMTPLLQGAGFNAIFFHRERSGLAEVHKKLADFLVVKEGEGAVVVGGTVVAPKESAPGEIRGSGIQGGTRYALAPGDVIYIPANTPHQMIVAEGNHLDAAVIKIETKE